MGRSNREPERRGVCYVGWELRHLYQQHGVAWHEAGDEPELFSFLPDNSPLIVATVHVDDLVWDDDGTPT